MKTYRGIVLSLLFLLIGIVPSLGMVPGGSPPAKKMSAPVVYKDLMLVISTNDGVAAVVFGADIEQGVTYRYRVLPKEPGNEQSGDGKVFEKYELTPIVGRGGNPGFARKDLGSQLFITAGPIKLEWSHADKDKGWIYYEPEKARVQIANARDFEKLDLKRFAK